MMKTRYSAQLSSFFTRAKHYFGDSHTSSIAFSLALSLRKNLKHSKQSFSSCTRAKRCFSDFHTSSITFGLATRSSGARLNRVSGFTLIEVVVALAIFALASMALTKVAMQYTQSTANSILRTKAQFVAQNEIAQMEINGEWLEGTQSKQVTAQGETWQIDKKSEATISPSVQKIDIQISLFDAEQGKVRSSVSNMVFYNAPIKANS